MKKEIITTLSVAHIYFTEITQFFNSIPDHLWCIFCPWLEFKNSVAVSILAVSSETVRKQSFSLLHCVNNDIPNASSVFQNQSLQSCCFCIRPWCVRLTAVIITGVCFRNLHHFLTCYTLITQSSCTSINWT